MTKYFQVLMKHTDGTTSILAHHNRTKWAYRTASRHLHDCVCSKMNNNAFPNVDYFAVIAAI